MKEAHDTDVGDLFKVKLAKKAYHLGKKGMLYFHYLPKLLLNFSAFLRKKMALPPFISANFFEKGFSGVISAQAPLLRMAYAFQGIAVDDGWTTRRRDHCKGRIRAWRRCSEAAWNAVDAALGHSKHQLCYL